MLGTIELNRNNIIGADQLITLVSMHIQESCPTSTISIKCILWSECVYVNVEGNEKINFVGNDVSHSVESCIFSL